MTLSSDTPVQGIFFPAADVAVAGPPVEVCTWLTDGEDAAERPSSGTHAALQLGAEGLRLSAPSRTWYVAYRDLEGHEAGDTGVLLRLSSGRCLELRTPAPHRLQQLLEGRLTAYARHVILAQRLPHASSSSTPTSQLLAALENPATASEERLAIATWLGTRPLEQGDALYLRRIVRDIADAELAATILTTLDLGDA